MPCGGEGWSLVEQTSYGGDGDGGGGGGGDVYVDVPSCQQWMSHSSRNHEGTGAVGRKTWKHLADAAAARLNIQNVG
jgi:hypothetical protein